MSSMHDQKPTLVYANKSIPGDSRPARRLIVLVLFLLLVIIVTAPFWWDGLWWLLMKMTPHHNHDPMGPMVNVIAAVY